MPRRHDEAERERRLLEAARRLGRAAPVITLAALAAETGMCLNAVRPRVRRLVASERWPKGLSLAPRGRPRGTADPESSCPAVDPQEVEAMKRLIRAERGLPV